MRIIAILAVNMRTSRMKIWFLLGYLALLWNVGPSAHHAEMFGFHDQAAHAPKISGDCGCNHHACDSASDLSDVNLSETQFDTTCGDCLFCWYFDHFSAVDMALVVDLERAPLFCVIDLADSAFVQRSIVCFARGPPLQSMA